MLDCARLVQSVVTYVVLEGSGGHAATTTNHSYTTCLGLVRKNTILVLERLAGSEDTMDEVDNMDIVDEVDMVDEDRARGQSARMT